MQSQPDVEQGGESTSKHRVCACPLPVLHGEVTEMGVASEAQNAWASALGLGDRKSG